jgi:hypothetical protein
MDHRSDGKGSGLGPGSDLALDQTCIGHGAIEQLLSGWVFGLIPGEDGDFDRAREMVVETICGGLEPRNGAS